MDAGSRFGARSAPTAFIAAEKIVVTPSLLTLALFLEIL